METGSYSEAGRRLGISRQAARQLVARAAPLHVSVRYEVPAGSPVDRETLEAIGQHVRRTLTQVQVHRPEQGTTPRP